MAKTANTPRQATTRALAAQVEALGRVAGLVVKATRDFKNPESLTQEAVASAASTTQPVVSDLETIKQVPNDTTLRSILDASGFDMSKPGSLALEALLKVIRDHGAGLEALPDEVPE